VRDDFGSGHGCAVLKILEMLLVELISFALTDCSGDLAIDDLKANWANVFIIFRKGDTLEVFEHRKDRSRKISVNDSLNDLSEELSELCDIGEVVGTGYVDTEQLLQMFVSGFIESVGDQVSRLPQDTFDEVRVNSDFFDIFISRDIVVINRLDLLIREARISRRRMLLLQLSKDFSRRNNLATILFQLTEGFPDFTDFDILHRCLVDFNSREAVADQASRDFFFDRDPKVNKSHSSRSSETSLLTHQEALTIFEKSGAVIVEEDGREQKEFLPAEFGRIVDGSLHVHAEEIAHQLVLIIAT